MNVFTFTVTGRPAPQGSKRSLGNGVMIESSKHVKPWREDVRHAATRARPASANDGVLFDGPVHLYITFYFARPKSHYGTGRNATTLKPGMPSFVSRMPDLSKLIRSTEDAMTSALVWRDDAQVVAVDCRKVYSENGHQGADIRVLVAERDNDRADFPGGVIHDLSERTA